MTVAGAATIRADVLFFGLVAAGLAITSVTLAQARLSADRLFLDNTLVARRRAYVLSPALATAAMG